MWTFPGSEVDTQRVSTNCYTPSSFIHTASDIKVKSTLSTVLVYVLVWEPVSKQNRLLVLSQKHCFKSRSLGNFLLVAPQTHPPPPPKVYKSPSTSADEAPYYTILTLGHHPPWLGYSARKLAFGQIPT